MKSFLKIFGLVIGCLALIAFYFFVVHLSDLRTDTVKDNPDPIGGRALLLKMGAAHNIAAWDSVDTYTVAFEDDFYGMVGENGHPFPQHDMEMILDYIPDSNDGRMSFTDGVIWGVQSWNTYIRQAAGEPVKKSDDDIKFWVPTYQYFLEFPMRIQTATAVTVAGKKVIDGTPCVGVLASWDKYKPQRNIDQYLIWIDEETSVIKELEYTIRDIMGLLKGRVRFENYQTFNNIPIPTKMPVWSNMASEKIHEMRVNGIHVNVVSQSDLRPFDLPVMGDVKN